MFSKFQNLIKPLVPTTCVSWIVICGHRSGQARDLSITIQRGNIEILAIQRIRISSAAIISVPCPLRPFVITQVQVRPFVITQMQVLISDVA